MSLHLMDPKSAADAVILPHPNELLRIESLDYNNPYDFHQLHRHDYFELILISEGEGTQLIDFSSYPMKELQVSMVYPGQVHLMHRGTANGLLIQFRKDVFEFLHPLKHVNLYFSEPIIELNAPAFAHLLELTQCIQSLQHQELSALGRHKAYSYLQIILISLVETRNIQFTEEFIVSRFLFLVSEHIHSKRKVSEYCGLMNCTTEKLNELCRKTLSKNALQLIHEEVLLEIKRLLLLGQLSLKEIAYALNFDSQANFNGFIKSRLQLSPSELQAEVRAIYQ